MFVGHGSPTPCCFTSSFHNSNDSPRDLRPSDFVNGAASLIDRGFGSCDRGFGQDAPRDPDGSSSCAYGQLQLGPMTVNDSVYRAVYSLHRFLDSHILSFGTMLPCVTHAQRIQPSIQTCRQPKSKHVYLNAYNVLLNNVSFIAFDCDFALRCITVATVRPGQSRRSFGLHTAHFGPAGLATDRWPPQQVHA